MDTTNIQYRQRTIVRHYPLFGKSPNRFADLQVPPAGCGPYPEGSGPDPDALPRFIKQLQDTGKRRQFVYDALTLQICAQVYNLRMAHSLSLHQVHNITGLSYPVLANMENTERIGSWPSVTTLARIAHAFGLALQIRFVSFGDLIEDCLEIQRKVAALAISPGGTPEYSHPLSYSEEAGILEAQYQPSGSQPQPSSENS